MAQMINAILSTTAEARPITVVIIRRSHVNSYEKETGRVTTSRFVKTHHSTTRRVVSKVAALVNQIPLVSVTDNCVSELEISEPSLVARFRVKDGLEADSAPCTNVDDRPAALVRAFFAIA